MNYVQVDEASQCDISNYQMGSKPTDSINMQTEAQEMLPALSDNSLSNSSVCQRYRSVESVMQVLLDLP